jgi:hypothetical protein
VGTGPAWKNPKVLVPAVVPVLIAGLATVSIVNRPIAVAPGCTLEVSSRVAIIEPSITPPHHLGPDYAAAAVVEAAWRSELADGTAMNESYFYLDHPSTWYVFDRSLTGVQYWHPAGARRAGDPQSGSVPQNSPFTDVRLGSRSVLVARRTGKLVTLDLLVSRYDPATHEFEPWPGATGYLELRAPGTDVWYPFRAVTVDASGMSAEVVRLSAKRDYRLRVLDSADTWGTESRAVRKV